MLRGLRLSERLKRLLWKAVGELDIEELMVFTYVLREVSVGWIVALEELGLETGLEEDEIKGILADLRDKGYLDIEPNFVINLSPNIRRILAEEARERGSDLLSVGRELSSVLLTLLR